MDTPTARHVLSIWPKPFSESVLKSATISKPQDPTFIATFRTTIHRNEFPFLFELERFMNERAIFLLFDWNLQPSCWRDTENIRRSWMSFGVQQNILMRFLMRFLIRFLKRFTKVRSFSVSHSKNRQNLTAISTGFHNKHEASLRVLGQ